MRKLGRNDPCHCGSGQKYKKCCLAKDEAGNVTRMTSADPGQSLRSFIHHELSWTYELHKQIAHLFINSALGHYPENEIKAVLDLWHQYAEEVLPITHKPGVFPATLEYILCHFCGRPTTQKEIAQKHNVSAGSLSQRYGQIMDYIEESELPPSAAGQAVQAPRLSRTGMEQGMMNIVSMLEGHNFTSIDEANAFLRDNVIGKIPSKTKKSVSKKEQATELLYQAWDEPNVNHKIKLAQDALLLYPDSADAYNILAEFAATTPKKAAYYYKQGMLAGERDLGESFMDENKGHFWGYVPTRPYMRAKKGYADMCAELDNMPEAIKHYEELLELNPNDNQGVRDLLLSVYIEIGDWKKAAALIEKYDVDESASFNYSRILVEHGLHGKSPRIEKLIKNAISQNPHVPDYLQGKKRLPNAMPEYIGYGDEREAVAYSLWNFHLWQVRPELLRLLTVRR